MARIPVSCQLHWFPVWSISGNIPSLCSLHLKTKPRLDGLTVCLFADRLLLCFLFFFVACETGKSSITNYRRLTQSIAGPELSSDSIQLSRNQNRSNADTQSNAKKTKKQKTVHLATRNNLFLRSPQWNLLLQSVTSQSTFSPRADWSVN